MTLSSLFFLIASFSRIEFLIFILGTYLFLFLFRRDKRLGDLLFFSLPVFILLSITIAGLMLSNKLEASFFHSYLWPKLLVYLKNINNYNIIKSSLKYLNESSGFYFPYKFLEQIKEILWFIPIGILFKKIVKAYFFPYFIIILSGFSHIKENERKEPAFLYFIVLSITTVSFLYVYYLFIWLMSTRYITILLFSTIPLMGLSVQQLMNFFRESGRRKLIGVFLMILIAGVTLVKDLKPRDSDKYILKEIGEYIAEIEPRKDEIEIATSSGLVSFYANLKKKGAPCPVPVLRYSTLIHKECNELIKTLQNNGIHYLLWEEEYWKNPICPFDKQKELKRVKKWEKSQNKRYILYRLLGFQKPLEDGEGL